MSPKDTREENKRLGLALQTVRHGTGNQLAMLAAILALQARASDDPRVRQALETAQQRVCAIADAMRLDALGDADELVSSKVLVERSVDSLSDFASQAGIEIEVDVQEVQFQREDAFSYMLIINELVVNSLRHAFPHKTSGKVSIRFGRQSGAAGEFLVLVVEDDGIGRLGKSAAGAGIGTTAIASATQSLGAEFCEEPCFLNGEQRGLRTTVSRPCAEPLPVATLPVPHRIGRGRHSR